MLETQFSPRAERPDNTKPQTARENNVFLMVSKTILQECWLHCKASVGHVGYTTRELQQKLLEC